MRRISPQTIGRAAALHPWRTIAVWAAIIGLAIGAIALLLPGTLTAEYSFVGNPDSQVGRDLLADRMDMPRKATEVVVLQSRRAAATDPGFRAAVLALQSRIAALGPDVVDSVASPFKGGSPEMISADGHTAIIPIVMAGDVPQAEDNIARVHDLVDEADGRDGVTTMITGTASISSDFGETADRDLRTGEGIGLPIALVILLIVFGTLIAAGLPIVLSLIAITVAVALTAVLGNLTNVSVFAVNMVSMMGLAVGIDYSLFIVSRFREELARGRSVVDAVSVTSGTASRAVFFSGMTVVLALVGMLIVPTNVFVSLGAGAILVVAAAVLAAMTLLPALLGLLGHRVNSLKVPYLGRRLLDPRAPEKPSIWSRAARGAMRRPALALGLGVGVLLLAASPLIGMKTGVSGVVSLPDSFQSKTAFGVLSEEFSGGLVSPIQIVVDGPAESPQTQAAIAALKTELAQDPTFGQVTAQTNDAGDLTLLQVPSQGEASSPQAIAAVRELRDTLVPKAFGDDAGSVYVAGETAANVDYIDIVNAYFPWVIALILALSFVLLMLAFRSVVIPATAIVMNLLSVGAAYGLITLVSQEGVGAGLLGFQQVPQIEQWVPLFLFSVLFGLSMDYQVFLLSRIKEEYDRSGDNTAAVAAGIGKTAGIITGAALIMVAVFVGFANGSLVMFQQMGFGLAVAVLLDATLVRTLIVPSAMKLLGDWNWYLPRWLEWLPRLSIEGTPAPPPASESAGRPEADTGPEGCVGPQCGAPQAA